MGRCIRSRCTRDVYARRLCHSHYQMARLAGELPPSEAVDRACAWCGEKMINRRSARAKYCTPECKERGRIANRRDDRQPVIQQRTCVQCGDFVPTTRFGKAITCSADCAITYQNRVKAERLLEERKALDRHCKQCGEPISPEKRNGVLYCTRKCKTKAGHVRPRSPEKQAQARAYNRAWKYGLDQAGYDALLAAQGGVCASCGTSEWNGRGDGPDVDHCHATGAIRGLLCAPCNRGIGHFGDDPERLEAAAAYLRRAREVAVSA